MTPIQAREDYAHQYSSLTDEELRRLSEDLVSLLPTARSALRAEMERRHLPSDGIDWALKLPYGTSPQPYSPRNRRGEEFHTERSEVVITDIRMPFTSMVVFMVKWAIASIPALICLIVITAFAWAIIIGLVSGLFERH